MAAAVWDVLRRVISSVAGCRIPSPLASKHGKREPFATAWPVIEHGFAAQTANKVPQMLLSNGSWTIPQQHLQE
jgi:hypothetical protein